MSTPSTSSEPSRVADQTRWFAEEVHTHDARLKAYVRVSFPAVRDVEDVVQESYLRIWKARKAEPIKSAKAFLFRIARNLALDRLRRSHISPIRNVDDLAALSVVDEDNDPYADLALGDKASLLSDALVTLSPRSREVIILCKLNGMTHRDAALRLGLSEKTVNEHMLRGLKRLSDELRRRGQHTLFGA